MTTSSRRRLQMSAVAIAVRYGKLPRPAKALSKLFIAPRWIGHGKRASGLRRWKRGELLEWITADSSSDRRTEWGDVGYYVAQTWSWLWRVYEFVTPTEIIVAAVDKFERRAERNEDVTHI